MIFKKNLNLILVLIFFLMGCKNNINYNIFEILPSFKDCYIHKEKVLIEYCEKANLNKQNYEINNVLNKTISTQIIIHQKPNRCKYFKNRPSPPDCSISIISRKGTFPNLSYDRD